MMLIKEIRDRRDRATRAADASKWSLVTAGEATDRDRAMIEVGKMSAYTDVLRLLGVDEL